MDKNKKTVTLVDAYEHYAENTTNPVDKATYLAINKMFNQRLSNSILDNNEFKIPSRLGSIRIKAFKTSTKELRPDWAATTKLWDECSECKEKKQLVYHLNEHSDGWYNKWYWSKKTAIFANKKVYSFTPSRRNKREIARLVKTENKRYFA